MTNKKQIFLDSVKKKRGEKRKKCQQFNNNNKMGKGHELSMHREGKLKGQSLQEKSLNLEVSQRNAHLKKKKSPEDTISTQ